MIQLESNELVFAFPDVHESARLEINFQRTLRIPDDGEDYPLPENTPVDPTKARSVGHFFRAPAEDQIARTLRDICRE